MANILQEIGFDKESFKSEVKKTVRKLFLVSPERATQQQLFQAVSAVIEDLVINRWLDYTEAVQEQKPKTVYYLSMEFLMGRALGNNLINLGVYDDVKQALEELHLDINALEDQEPDPALGNGGLGRLAACFLDSLATLGYNAYGCGIRYHYGMFKQEIEDGFQREVPDNWLKERYPFELKRAELAKEVRFGGNTRTEYDPVLGKNKFLYENFSSVLAVPYDIPIVGYKNGVVDVLRIWDAEAINNFELSSFDRGDYAKAVEQENLAKTITEVLYPTDHHKAGKELRLKQQYFFVSASIQEAVRKFVAEYKDLSLMPEKVAFQLNDTHPTVTVPELMRILIDDYGLEWDEAWDITTRTCAYTNHTIMQEALEKWPIDLFQKLLPRVYQIVDEINRRFVEEVQKQYPGDESKLRNMAPLYDGQIRMAYLAIVGSHSVNGVAELHTEILKNNVLHDFYELMPEKFNNKTNGVTQRRFLKKGNPLLAKWITRKLGNEDWVTDLSQLEKLKPLAEDTLSRHEFMRIKHANKVRLADYIKAHNGIEVDPGSIFDVQVKRLHEYKRQLLNILHVIYLYDTLKDNPNMEFYPRTFIFGAKASAGYEIAKLIIKLINSVSDVINNDPDMRDRLKVVFIEDYKVSNGEIIFAAADLSEQISTASKEASGTGNMKFMINGAPTIGTMDGANVEIVREVGEENAFIFGLSSDQVINYETWGGYDPVWIYETDTVIHRILNQLIDGTFSEDRELFRPIYNSLLTGAYGNPDKYFILADFWSYVDAQKRVEAAYRDRDRWAKMALLNTASSGKFSSDRTIQQYVDDIWHLDKVTVAKKAEKAADETEE